MEIYRKKPVEVEAVQFTGDNLVEVYTFMTGAPPVLEDDAQQKAWEHRTNEVQRLGFLTIPTLEGDHNASPGDWIIKGTAGELYPCKPNIFAEIYEGPITIGRTELGAGNAD